MASKKLSTNSSLIVELRITDYMEALKLQHFLVQARLTGSLTRDVLIVLEHSPVFTLGRKGNRQGLLVKEDTLAAKGIQVVHVERGGDVTYHGPGQVVLYPIFDLKAACLGVTEFVKALEEIMIRTALDWGVNAERNPLNRGVWIGLKKLGSVGVAIRKDVSFHGLALNVNTDLHPFTWINPCGMAGCMMTSMKEEVGEDIPIKDIYRAFVTHVQEIFCTTCERIDIEYLRKMIEDKTTSI